ncbi:MAG: protein-PII uridylyltransferase [Leptospiraceae bacterium]|nr:protein-PII uridylyltransferase [Leptospiraceae bacterium]
MIEILLQRLNVAKTIYHFSLNKNTMPIILDLKSRFQHTLEKSRHISGRFVCRQLTYIVDAEIVRLYRLLEKKIPEITNRFCIVAIGGYGRMELAPYSDIDLLYLHNGLSDLVLTEVISSINTFLYDSGKEVGHSCRTIEQCREQLDNINTFYAMLDSRFLTGSEELFFSYENYFLKNLPVDILAQYNQSKINYLHTTVNSDSPLLVSEPDLKNGHLCLRNIQVAYWIEKSTSYIPSLSGLALLPIFTHGEVQKLENAYDFLLRARVALHAINGRKVDRLDLTLQPDVAEYMGFGVKTELESVDMLMNTLYVHQNEIHSFLGIYLDYKKNQFGQMETLNKTEFFLQRQGNYLYPPKIGKLFSNPESLYADILQIFYISHTLNLSLSPSLISELRFASYFLQEDFINSNHAIEFFLRILKESRNIGRILTSMHRAGILGKFLPEFGECTNFSLFSYHHQYPVDEHTLYILRELDTLLNSTFDDKEVQEVFNECEKIYILALAIIVHDAGKVKQGDHCQYGAELATAIGERLGLSDEDNDLFKFLVEVHIHMSELTSKRDINDPELLLDFAHLVGTESRLKLLYVFTIIDTKSVGPNVLTNWKKAILYSLYKNTLEVLRRPNNSLFVLQINKEQEILKNYLLQKEKLNESLTNQVLLFASAMLPNTYLRYNTPRRIIRQFLMHMKCKSNPSEIPEIEYEKEPAYVTVIVYSLEDRYLLSDLTGTVTSEALSVIGMRSYKNSNGFVISQIQITDSFGGGDIRSERLDRLTENIRAVINKKINVEDILSSPIEWMNYNTIPAGMVAQKIEFNNLLSADYTILEILLPDSLGLLYRIIKQILSFDVQLHFVRVSTSADYAYDSFYIKSGMGNKIEDVELLKKMEQEIANAASKKIKTENSYIEY